MACPQSSARNRIAVGLVLGIVGALSAWHWALPHRSVANAAPREKGATQRSEAAQEASRQQEAGVGTNPARPGAQAVEPHGALRSRESNWLEAFPPEQRAPANDERAVLQMLDVDIHRLYGTEEEYVIVQPDGTVTKTVPDVVADNLEPVGLYSVNVYDREPDLFDYMVAAYKNKLTGKVALIATLLVRDGIAIPGEYKAFPNATGPANYPFLAPSEAESIVREKVGAPIGDPRYVFYPSPVSPRPMVFLYEFETPRGLAYVSQDGAVWTDIAAMRQVKHSAQVR